MNKILQELIKESVTTTKLPLNYGATILINDGNKLTQIRIKDFVSEIKKLTKLEDK